MLWRPSMDSAVRSPVPLMMTASEFPLDQPGRPTIAWITEAIFGVLWSSPASCLAGQVTGDHATAATVRGLEEMFPLDAAKVAASSAS